MSDDNAQWAEWNQAENQRSNRGRTAPIDQVNVESEILRLVSDLEDETEVFEGMCKDAAVAEAEWKKNYYDAYLHSEGPVEARKAFAGYRHAESYLNAQVTEALVKAKRERLHSIRTQLDALRTIAANVRSQVQS
jgi:hypothetical protein